MEHDNTLSTLANLGLAAARERAPLQDGPRRMEPPMIIVAGVVATSDGLCGWDIYSGTTEPDGTLRASKQSLWRADPASDYAAEQPAAIPVHLEHNRARKLGEVVHLERRHGQLYAVALVNLPYEDVEGLGLRWSAGTSGTTRPFTITELSLTRSPASVGLPAVKFYPTGDLSNAIAYPGNRPLLRSAIEAQKRRGRDDPLWIHDPETPGLGEPDVGVLLERSTTVAHISTTQRLVEIVAVPYEQEAQVYWRDQWWTEVFAHGAFAEFIRSGELPRVNREHTKGDTVGKIVELREKPDGLVATIKIADTARGTETLTLAKEGMISASAGFIITDPGGRIVDQQRRFIRVLRARLDHLSLVEAPAYAGAKVLSVRRR